MKLFARHGGYWLFWASAVYLAIAFWSISNSIDLWWLQPVWLLIISLPLTVPSLGRWLNLDIDWDRKMFDWLKGKKDSKVVPFPEVPKSSYTEPRAEPEQEKPATTYYRIGTTSDNRVSFSMGYSEITMSPLGVQNMIDQLELFKKQVEQNLSTEPNNN